MNMTTIHTGTEKWTFIQGKGFRIARNVAPKETRVCKRPGCTTEFTRHFYTDQREEKKYCGRQCANLCRRKKA